MAHVADRCGGVFTVVLDGPESHERWWGSGLSARFAVVAGTDRHQTVQAVIRQGTSDYVLMLDDDERCTEGLVNWLATEQYRTADFWYIRRAWLYKDARHYISSPKHWPNPSLRIGRRELITVPTAIHAGWMQGPGTKAEAPFAIEHHKFLIRSLDERKETVAQYEAIRKDAGMPHHYLPECVMVDVAEWHG